MLKMAAIACLLVLLGACTQGLTKNVARQEVVLCPQIRLAAPPEHRLAFYGPSTYRDGLVVPTMVASMSSREVIEQILKVCPSPLNTPSFSLRLFEEYPVRSGDHFYRAQVYSLTSPEYSSIHGGTVTSILVWFNPDGSIHGIYHLYTIYSV